MTTRMPNRPVRTAPLTASTSLDGCGKASMNHGATTRPIPTTKPVRQKTARLLFLEFMSATPGRETLGFEADYPLREWEYACQSSADGSLGRFNIEHCG